MHEQFEFGFEHEENAQFLITLGRKKTIQSKVEFLNNGWGNPLYNVS